MLDNMIAKERESFVLFVQNLMHCYTLSYTYIGNNIFITVAPAVSCHQQSSICRLLLMFCSVTETKFVTDSTDSIFSFAAGEGLMRVWMASVSRDPPWVFLSS